MVIPCLLHAALLILSQQTPRVLAQVTESSVGLPTHANHSTGAGNPVLTGAPSLRPLLDLGCQSLSPGQLPWGWTSPSEQLRPMGDLGGDCPTQLSWRAHPSVSWLRQCRGLLPGTSSGILTDTLTYAPSEMPTIPYNPFSVHHLLHPRKGHTVHPPPVESQNSPSKTDLA